MKNMKLCKFNILIAALVLITVTALGTGIAQIGGNPSDGTPVDPMYGVDHYRCYTVSPPARINRGVTLQDQFRTNGARVTKSRLLCAPVSKNGEPVYHPEIHLEAYEIKDPPLMPPAKVTLSNQFGTETTQVKKPVLLLVPTLKTRLDCTATICPPPNFPVPPPQ